MRITPVGDSALRIELGERIDEATSQRVHAACAALDAAAIPGLTELVPAYTTVTAHYDVPAAVAAGAPVDDIAGWLSARAELALGKLSGKSARKAANVEIPVCFGGEFGPDLARVAAHAKLSPEEVVKRHAAAHYTVALVGFSPGFPYLIGLPPVLATPRLAQPRAQVPAGSVGIAGGQTGVYPLATPGGWNLIGRTPLRLFRPEQNPPVLLQPGDRVRFRAITREEFARQEAAR
ncbi:MAG: 5-oxoprolinase subunit PxpB [Candidatus Didemnitutus sp.]|nr:5-oxoprolinase subunit PxpB [Candidatus Didemnitutus sp.]